MMSHVTFTIKFYLLAVNVKDFATGVHSHTVWLPLMRISNKQRNLPGVALPIGVG